MSDESPEMLQYKLQTIYEGTGTKQAATDFKEVGEAATKAGADQVKADGEAFTSKKELRHAVQGLREEFPLLGRIAHMAINPIALVVAGLAGAFAIWRTRVDELSKTLAGVELPDVSDDRVGRVFKAATAWKEYGDAIRQAVDAYHSVEQASDRAAKKIDAEHERNKKLLESQKSLALAKLEADKASLKPGEYEKRQAEIEAFYDSVGVKEDEATKRKKLQNKAQEVDQLNADAAAKKAEAGKIKVVDAEQDERVLAKSKAAADAANADLEERKKKLTELFEARDNVMSYPEQLVYAFKFGARYGTMTGTEAIAQEQQDISTDQRIIDTYNRSLGKKEGRADLRKRRSELEAGAGKEEGEAKNLRESLFGKGGELDQFDADATNQRQVERKATLARTYKAAGEVGDKAHDITQRIAESVETGSKVMTSTVDKLAEYQATLKQLQRRIATLENTNKLNPPGT